MNRQKLSENAIALIAGRFRVLGEPMRLKLLIALEHQERNVSELVTATGAPPLEIVLNVKILEEAQVFDILRAQSPDYMYFTIMLVEEKWEAFIC